MGMWSVGTSGVLAVTLLGGCANTSTKVSGSAGAGGSARDGDAGGASGTDRGGSGGRDGGAGASASGGSPPTAAAGGMPSAAVPAPAEGGAAGAPGEVPDVNAEGGAAGSGSSMPGGGSSGEPCQLEGALKCAGRAQRSRLICSNGIWAAHEACPVGHNCDAAAVSAGSCQRIVEGCAGKGAGATTCDANTVVECGADLVDVAALEPCVGRACVDGACTGTCAPGTARCAGNAVEVCSNAGEWEKELCPSGEPLCVDGECRQPPSCVGLPATCGATKDESCCTSIVVPGGTFSRGNDATYPAAVSSFRLDKYEVTVGRFRKFLTAWDQGWRPALGSGKHTHLHDGKGLSEPGGAAYEAGWTIDMLTGLYASFDEWSPRIIYVDQLFTWTESPARNENRPMNMSIGAGSYAFCIWDGGFLPSEAEWNYAAAGGTQQRLFPWGGTFPEENANRAVYGCFLGAPMSCDIADVGSAPSGNGRWGHADLAGSFEESTLDAYGVYQNPCVDCARLPHDPAEHALRGGNYATTDPFRLQTDYRAPGVGQGVRCARSP